MKLFIRYFLFCSLAASLSQNIFAVPTEGPSVVVTEWETTNNVAPMAIRATYQKEMKDFSLSTSAEYDFIPFKIKYEYNHYTKLWSIYSSYNISKGNIRTSALYSDKGEKQAVMETDIQTGKVISFKIFDLMGEEALSAKVMEGEKITIELPVLVGEGEDGYYAEFLDGDNLVLFAQGTDQLLAPFNVKKILEEMLEDGSIFNASLLKDLKLSYKNGCMIWFGTPIDKTSLEYLSEEFKEITLSQIIKEQSTLFSENGVIKTALNKVGQELAATNKTPSLGVCKDILTSIGSIFKMALKNVDAGVVLDDASLEEYKSLQEQFWRAVKEYNKRGDAHPIKDPMYSKDVLDRGVILCKGGKYKEGMALINIALKGEEADKTWTNVQYDRAYYYLSLTLLALKDYSGASLLFQKALQYKSDKTSSAGYYYNMGLAELYQERYIYASEFFDKATEKRPNLETGNPEKGSLSQNTFAKACYLSGFAYAKRGKFYEANARQTLAKAMGFPGMPYEDADIEKVNTALAEDGARILDDEMIIKLLYYGLLDQIISKNRKNGDLASYSLMVKLNAAVGLDQNRGLVERLQQIVAKTGTDLATLDERQIERFRSDALNAAEKRMSSVKEFLKGYFGDNAKFYLEALLNDAVREGITPKEQSSKYRELIVVSVLLVYYATKGKNRVFEVTGITEDVLKVKSMDILRFAGRAFSMAEEFECSPRGIEGRFGLSSARMDAYNATYNARKIDRGRNRP